MKVVSVCALIVLASMLLASSPLCFSLPIATYLGKDIVTKGDWTHAVGSPLGTYGSYAHILPNPPVTETQVPVGNFSVPVGNFTYYDYNWIPSQIAGLPFNRTAPPYWDEYVSLSPPVTYFLTGNQVIIPEIGLVKYPVFEWAWDNFNSSDIRACVFKTNVPGAGGPGTRLTCWDDGGERTSSPLKGYFNITMSFPAGQFMLSLYAYDKEGGSRDNQIIYITDTSGGILSTATMSGTDLDGGIYEQFVIYGPTTVVVQVSKSLTSLNALLSGIFVDKFVPETKHYPTGGTVFSVNMPNSLTGYATSALCVFASAIIVAVSLHIYTKRVRKTE
ncbi:hypothetical protein MUP37_05615 [Candidatus Bathyarchaeota archaeon]|nr:hypothetical protein [Candidatus Bathyarchaeota archaeon]